MCRTEVRDVVPVAAGAPGGVVMSVGVVVVGGSVVVGSVVVGAALGAASLLGGGGSSGRLRAWRRGSTSPTGVPLPPSRRRRRPPGAGPHRRSRRPRPAVD